MSDHDHATTETAHGDDHDHGGIGKYLAVFVALCGLTTLSFLTYFEFWREAVPVEASRTFMMAVSCTKAMLVIMFFMHLLWEASWKWVLTIPASCMSVFLAVALVPDIGCRQNNGYGGYSRERMLYAAEPAAAGEAEGDHSNHEDHQGEHAGNDDHAAH